MAGTQSNAQPVTLEDAKAARLLTRLNDALKEQTDERTRRIAKTPDAETVPLEKIEAATQPAPARIKPLEDRILQATASGLVIPDTAKEKPWEGKVLFIGGGIDENHKRVPLDVAEGDVVIVSKYDGREMLLLNARDILASSSSKATPLAEDGL